jgi:hypothetical protein
MRNTLVSAGLSLLVVSCSSEPGGSTDMGGMPGPSKTIGVTQASGLTNAEPQHPVRLVVRGEAEQLQSLLSTIATFDGEPASVGAISEESPMVLHVMPSTPLAEGWHELTLTSDEFDTGGSDGAGWNDSSGAFHHRFFVGSAPYVMAAFLSPDKGKGGSLVVQFSEPIEYDDLATGLDASVDGNPIGACVDGPSACLASTMKAASGDVVTFQLEPGPALGVAADFSMTLPAATNGAARTFAEAMALDGFASSGLVANGSQLTLSVSKSDWKACDAGFCWTSPLAIVAP